MSDTLPYRRDHPVRFVVWAFFYGLLWPVFYLHVVFTWKDKEALFIYLIALTSLAIFIVVGSPWYYPVGMYALLTGTVWWVLYRGVQQIDREERNDG